MVSRYPDSTCGRLRALRGRDVARARARGRSALRGRPSAAGRPFAARAPRPAARRARAASAACSERPKIGGSSSSIGAEDATGPLAAAGAGSSSRRAGKGMTSCPLARAPAASRVPSTSDARPLVARCGPAQPPQPRARRASRRACVVVLARPRRLWLRSASTPSAPRAGMAPTGATMTGACCLAAGALGSAPGASDVLLGRHAQQLGGHERTEGPALRAVRMPRIERRRHRRLVRGRRVRWASPRAAATAPSSNARLPRTRRRVGCRAG